MRGPPCQGRELMAKKCQAGLLSKELVYLVKSWLDNWEAKQLNLALKCKTFLSINFIFSKPVVLFPQIQNDVFYELKCKSSSGKFEVHIFSYFIFCVLFILTLFKAVQLLHWNVSDTRRQFLFKKRFWSCFSDGHSVIQTCRTEINCSWKHFPLGKSQMRLNETFYIYSSKQS